MKKEEIYTIKDTGITYPLGIVKDKTIHYDFDKMRIFLESKGKSLYGQNFKLFHTDTEIIYKLCTFIVQDKEKCKKMNIDIHKGILLSGPVGSGKTTLMTLIRSLVPKARPYQIIPCRNAVVSYNHIGTKTITDYGDTGYHCFDDLGVEPIGKHFGRECNVMGEILLSRYDLFIKTKTKTHGTTNLNAKEIEDRYGSRVRSRMRQLFNLIAFEKGVVDKRI